MTDLDRSHIGTYRLIRQLTAGGMGAVFEAEDPRLRRRVALKTLPEHLAADPDQLRRLEREARTLAAVNHPNIVTIYSVEEDDGIVFLAMEWIEGRPLNLIIPDKGLDLETFFRYALQIADALDAAHQRGVIHRDVKPGNIMVGPDGWIKVLDFGLAKQGDPETEFLDSRPLTREGQMLGTLPYMSPEQLQGAPVDPRTDVFSFGIVLYEMVTGARPFQGSSWGDLASSILRDDPPSVTRLHLNLPHHLGRIIRHCLEKDVKRRFQTVLDLRNELAELQREIVTGELPTRPVSGRRPGTSLWLGMAGVALLGALGFAGIQAWRAPDDPPTHQQPAENLRKTIAISQFENLGPPEERYFAAGVTDEITSHLATVKALQVISRRTADDVGDAEYRLTGTVRWDPKAESGNRRVRVTPRLIRVADGTHIWSETYERVIDDIFAVQTEIASEVIRQMDIVLLEPERQAMETQPTASSEAFRAYLQGMDLAGRRDPSTRHWQQAVERFEIAVQLDPEFALAWAELSEIHSFVYQLRLDRSEDRLAEARRAAERALAIAPDLPQGHRALGYFYYWGHRDFDSALAAFERAEEGLPNDSQVLGGIAYVKRRQGQFDEASTYLLRALESDPESAWLATEVAITFHTMRRYREADRYLARAMELSPTESAVYRRRARNYLLWHGDLDSARATLEAMPEQHTSGAIISWYELELLAGNPRRAREYLDKSQSAIFGDENGIWPKSYLEGQARRLEGSTRVSQALVELAEVPLRSLLRGAPEDFRIHSALGFCYAYKDDREQALFHGRQAADLAPLSQDALAGAKMQENLAAILARLGDHQESLEILDRLLSMPADLSVPLLKIDPKWRRLWPTEGFKDLVAAHSRRADGRSATPEEESQSADSGDSDVPTGP